MVNQERHILFLNVSRTLVQYFPEMYNARRLEGTFSGNYMVESVENIALIQPDIILIDIEHEDQTSVWNRIQQLKTNGATASIPMLLCRGPQQTLPWAENFLYSQGIWLISKPFTRDEILVTISRIPLVRR
jgi:CheY-like chemotaxis protein